MPWKVEITINIVAKYGVKLKDQFSAIREEAVLGNKEQTNATKIFATVLVAKFSMINDIIAERAKICTESDIYCMYYVITHRMNTHKMLNFN